ncbi:MAG: GtrA family protein [Candidatus Staskawiczbacteria bacterium]|nr:GtrA family protein [Candidatus Staskawiczbacteria bacterium]
MKITGQVMRHVIVGGLADLADLACFQIFFWIFGADILSKTISFLFAVSIKYAGNKYWVFQKPEKDGIKREMLQFVTATVIGLLINVASFYFFVRIRTDFNANTWRLISVIFAMFVTAIWNFLTYKFLVFKK